MPPTAPTGWTPRSPAAASSGSVPRQGVPPAPERRAATLDALADAARRAGSPGTPDPDADGTVATAHRPRPARSRVRWAVAPRAAAAAALAVALLAGGVALRASTGPAGAPVDVPRPRVQADPTGPPAAAAVPTPSVQPAVVHVVGAVAAPGVVTLPGDARVADAVTAAGGAAPDADLAGLNLARTVVDGEQLRVPRAGEAVTAPAPATLEPGAVTGTAGAAPGPAGVDLNTADLAALDALPGVGPVLAQRILDRREEAPFTSVDELDEVSGIGPAVLERLRPHVRV